MQRMFLGRCLVNVGRMIHICVVHEKVFCVVCFYIYLFFNLMFWKKKKDHVLGSHVLAGGVQLV